MQIPPGSAMGVLLVSLAAAGSAQIPAKKPTPADGHRIVRAEALEWKPLRPGAETAVVSGDPAKAGAPFVMRFRYHGVVRVPPHWHPTDENLTVLSGTFVIGMGEKFDESSATEIPAGAYVLVPSKMAHYAWSKGDTVLQVHGIGPFTINYVNPADDPNKAAGRKGP
jgi:mannose-6-phosphate isomerase-like protein (cupin superfamily)